MRFIKAAVSVVGGCFILAIFVVFALRAQESYHYIIKQEAYHKGYIDGGEYGYQYGLEQCNTGVYQEGGSIATSLDP